MPDIEDYLDITADTLSEMNVTVQDTIAIFENDTGPIIRLCTQHKEYAARAALNDIGGALYTLRRQIQKLQAAVRDESDRQHAARKEAAAHD